jgi:hypothetical protein
MAFTYTTLKQAILDYVESDEQSLIDNLPTIVQQVEERILKKVQLPVFIKNSLGNCTIGNKYLALPSDFLTPYSVAVDTGADGYEHLLLKTPNFIREVYPSAAVQDLPKYYAAFDVSNLIFGPTPDQNYPVELHYFYRPDSIVVSETSWLGTNAPNAMLYGCLVEGYTYLKGDADLMGVYMQQFQEAMVRLEEFGEGYGTTDNYRGGQVRKPRS